MRSAGPDKRFDTADDFSTMLEVRTRKIAGPPTSDQIAIDLQIEHDRGPFNGRAEMVGSVKDSTGAAVTGATITAREAATGATRTATTNAAGQFTLAGLAAGDYQLRVSSPGFKIASRAVTLKVRDRAVLSAVLNVGAAMETVVVEQVAAGRIVVGGNVGGVMGGVIGGIAGGVPGSAASAEEAAEPPRVRGPPIRCRSPERSRRSRDEGRGHDGARRSQLRDSRRRRTPSAPPLRTCAPTSRRRSTSIPKSSPTAMAAPAS